VLIITIIAIIRAPSVQTESWFCVCARHCALDGSSADWRIQTPACNEWRKKCTVLKNKSGKMNSCMDWNETNIKGTTIWNVTPCRLVEVYRWVGRKCCLHFQSEEAFIPEQMKYFIVTAVTTSTVYSVPEHVYIIIYSVWLIWHTERYSLLWTLELTFCLQ
jgi:hypothetical protein